MKVDRVTATIKYSQDTGKGAWKAIELGAEATVEVKDNWQTAQHQLYGELSQQLKTLWSNGTGNTAQSGPDSHGEPSQVPEPTPTPVQPPEHLCQEHQTEYKRHERQGKVWYSHKGPDGKWCKESN